MVTMAIAERWAKIAVNTMVVVQIHNQNNLNSTFPICGITTGNHVQRQNTNGQYGGEYSHNIKIARIVSNWIANECQKLNLEIV
ncbi:hypothetical protein FGF1_07120 [Flavobacteriaceae bacterium GF1]